MCQWMDSVLRDSFSIMCPELDIAIGSDGTSLHIFALFSHDVLDCKTGIGKYLYHSDSVSPFEVGFRESHFQVISDQMFVLASWAGDKDGSSMIALLRDGMRRSLLTGLAGKCELIDWFLGIPMRCGLMGKCSRS